MERALYLGLDFGTSGLRACLIDRAERVLAEAAVPLPAPERTEDGGRVQAPDFWWHALEAVFAELDVELRQRIARIAVDGTSATLLVTDGEGRPLGPALMYDDASAAAEAEHITTLAPPESPARDPSASLAKLLRLAARHPDARHALHQADWISGRLAGRFGLSDENNALKLGYDPAERRWPGWVKEALGQAAALLPEVVPPGTPLGPIDPGLAARWALPETAQIVAGTTDSTAAVLATGVRSPGQAVTVLGSTLVLKVLSEAPVADAAHGVYSHRLGELWLAGGASNSGGAALARFFTPDEIEALSRRLRPGRRTCLDYYPLPAPGERFPVADPRLEPRVTPRPRDDARFLQGLLEGIARIERHGYRLLERLGAPAVREVVSIGGGAANEVWRLIREHMLGVPVRTARHRQPAFGTALLALREGP